MYSSCRWQQSPWGVNAYYSIPEHVVVFPAGLLQPPFFHPGYPRYGPFSEGESFGGRSQEGLTDVRMDETWSWKIGVNTFEGFFK